MLPLAPTIFVSSSSLDEDQWTEIENNFIRTPSLSIAISQVKIIDLFSRNYTGQMF